MGANQSTNQPQQQPNQTLSNSSNSDTVTGIQKDILDRCARLARGYRDKFLNKDFCKKLSFVMENTLNELDMEVLQGIQSNLNKTNVPKKVKIFMSYDVHNNDKFVVDSLKDGIEDYLANNEEVKFSRDYVVKLSGDQKLNYISDEIMKELNLPVNNQKGGANKPNISKFVSPLPNNSQHVQNKNAENNEAGISELIESISNNNQETNSNNTNEKNSNNTNEKNNNNTNEKNNNTDFELGEIGANNIHSNDNNNTINIFSNKKLNNKIQKLENNLEKMQGNVEAETLDAEVLEQEINNNNNSSSNMTKSKICKMIAKHYLVRLNIIAAILSALPYKGKDGHLQGFCYSRLKAISDGKICIPSGGIVEINKLSRDDLLEAIKSYINITDEKTCKEKGGYYKILSALETQSLMDSEYLYNRMFRDNYQKLMNSYINDLNLLLDILNELETNAKLNNNVVTLLSKKTKDVLRGLYNNCQMYYINSYICLLKADLDMKKNDAINTTLIEMLDDTPETTT